MLARTMTERNVYIALRERVALMGYGAKPCKVTLPQEKQALLAPSTAIAVDADRRTN